MQFFVQHSQLRDLYDKVAAGQRISETDALRLFESKDLNAVGAIADLARRRKVGSRASYIINRYINYSNYCILSCQFCSFARKKRDADGFQLSIEEIVGKAREALRLGITELHIVGGVKKIYDGVSCVEDNFVLFPENYLGNGAVVTLGSGGNLSWNSTNPSQYQWAVVYEWTDNYGQVQRSTPSIAVTATTGAPGQAAFLVGPTLRVTEKAQARSHHGCC